MAEEQTGKAERPLVPEEERGTPRDARGAGDAAGGGGSDPASRIGGCVMILVGLIGFAWCQQMDSPHRGRVGNAPPMGDSGQVEFASSRGTAVGRPAQNRTVAGASNANLSRRTASVTMEAARRQVEAFARAVVDQDWDTAAEINPLEDWETAASSPLFGLTKDIRILRSAHGLVTTQEGWSATTFEWKFIWQDDTTSLTTAVALYVPELDHWLVTIGDREDVMPADPALDDLAWWD